MSLVRAQPLPPVTTFLRDQRRYPGQAVNGSETAINIAFTGKNYDVYLFLARECSGGWFPSFKHGQGTVKSIMNCLQVVSDGRCANLRVGYPLPSATSPQTQDHLRTDHRSLREEVEACRSLCSDALAGLAADMDDICGKSGGLWTESGTLVRALKHYDEIKTFGSESRHYLKRTEDTHLEMLSTLALVANRWGKLRDHVSWLDGVLSEQLRRIESSQTALRQRHSECIRNIEVMRTKISVHQRSIDDNVSLYNQKIVKTNSVAQSSKNDKERYEHLSRELELKELELRQLVRQGEDAAQHFAEANEQREKDTAIKGWGEWAWDAVWNPVGNLNRLQQAAAWEGKVREHEEAVAARNIQVLESKKEISKLKDEIEILHLRNQHASKDHKRDNQELNSSQTKLNFEKLELEEEIETLRKKIRAHDNAVLADEAMISSLNIYQQIAPLLSGYIKEAQSSIDSSFRAYHHLHKKLQGCSPIIERLSQQMQKSQLSSEETKDLVEDIAFLRIQFLVVSDMAGRTVVVSRELYQEDLRIIAPLSVHSTPARSGGALQLQRGSTNYAKLTEMGDEAATGFDKIQRDAFNRLSILVEEIVKTSTLTKVPPQIEAKKKEEEPAPKFEFTFKPELASKPGQTTGNELVPKKTTSSWRAKLKEKF